MTSIKGTYSDDAISVGKCHENEDLASSKKVDIKLKKVDVSSTDEEVKTPVKKGRKRKSVEGEDESKVTPGKKVPNCSYGSCYMHS